MLLGRLDQWKDDPGEGWLQLFVVITLYQQQPIGFIDTYFYQRRKLNPYNSNVIVRYSSKIVPRVAVSIGILCSRVFTLFYQWRKLNTSQNSINDHVAMAVVLKMLNTDFHFVGDKNKSKWEKLGLKGSNKKIYEKK